MVLPFLSSVLARPSEPAGLSPARSTHPPLCPREPTGERFVPSWKGSLGRIPDLQTRLGPELAPCPRQSLPGGVFTFLGLVDRARVAATYLTQRPAGGKAAPLLKAAGWYCSSVSGNPDAPSAPLIPPPLGLGQAAHSCQTRGLRRAWGPLGFHSLPAHDHHASTWSLPGRRHLLQWEGTCSITIIIIIIIIIE